MMKKTSGKRSLLIIILLVLGFFLTAPSMTRAQVRTHTVVKGDTLWDLCEKYYGDPELWPKLWEMNPFITNPHLLNPGDVITLIEGMPFKKGFGQEDKTLAGEEAKKPVEETAVPLGMEERGIDVGSYINVKTLGFLSRKKVRPIGRIFSSNSKRNMLHKGDTAFVLFNSDVEVQPGDEFTIARSSNLIELPQSGENMGYAVSFNGQLLIERPAAIDPGTGRPVETKHIYEATITENYRTINVDDMVLPYDPVSSCIEPTPVDGQFTEKVAAGKDDMKVLGELSVVYFGRGFDQGVREGNLFELVRTNRVPSPHMDDKSYRNARILPRTKVNLPDLPIGVILIVDTRPDTSTGLVLSAIEEFYPGAVVRAGFTQLETTKYLSAVPICGKK